MDGGFLVENKQCGDNQGNACQTTLLSIIQGYLECFHKRQGVKNTHYVIYKSHNKRNDGV